MPGNGAFNGGGWLQTQKKYFRVDRTQIAYLKFIFEAYDGLANITTLDASQGTILMRVAPGREATADAVIQDLGCDMLIEPEPVKAIQHQAEVRI